MSEQTSTVYQVTFRHAATHDFIYARVELDGDLIWERPYFFKWRRYQRAAKDARKAIADHQRAMRILKMTVSV